MKVLLFLIFACVFAVYPVYAQTNPGFTTPVFLSTGGDTTNPQILVSDEGIFALWEQQPSSGKADVMFKKSTDGGSTFTNVIDLSESTIGQSGYSDFVQQKSDLYVIWQSSITGYAEVYVTKSSDTGDTFARPLLLSDQSKLAAFPQIATSKDNVYATWLEKSDNNATNVVFVKSTDKAKSFAKPVYITTHSGNSGVPKLLADGDNVYVLWEDNSNGNFDIYLAKSSDDGNSFSNTSVSNNSGQSGAPQFVVYNGSVYIAWMDNSSGNYDIMFTKSSDGKSFSKPINISMQKKDAGYPQLVVYQNNIYVVWTQTIEEPNYDIYFAKSTNNGDSFDPPVNISNNFGASGWPHVVSDGNVYLSWVDSSTGKFDVMITKSSDGGKTFENATNVSSSPAESYESQMATFGNQVFLVWQEGHKGNHAISFAKSTTFVPEFGPVASLALLVSVIAVMVTSLYLKRNKINF